MMPAADLPAAGAAVIAGEIFPSELYLAEHQRRIAHSEIQPVTVALLRIAGTGPRGVAVEDRAEHGDIVIELGGEPRADRGKRRRRAAGRQVNGGDSGPAQR